MDRANRHGAASPLGDRHAAQEREEGAVRDERRGPGLRQRSDRQELGVGGVLHSREHEQRPDREGVLQRSDPGREQVLDWAGTTRASATTAAPVSGSTVPGARHIPDGLRERADHR
ncbi:hypothetical protein Anae109_1548 [Anaeromyxobacter sp. Fw109-5]|nr:hypothetical protein Anae109_1548 [Anaeromyxobacter sp. Fw109-5]